MTILIAIISKQIPANNHVSKLVEGQQWDKIILIGDTKDSFSCNKEFDFVQTSERTTSELTDFLKTELKNKVSGTEVAINLISGEGKLHMALVSSILKLGMGIRLVVATKEGVREL